MNTQEHEPSLLRNEPRAQADGPAVSCGPQGSLAVNRKQEAKRQTQGSPIRLLN